MKTTFGLLLSGMVIFGGAGCSDQAPTSATKGSVDELQKRALAGDPLAAAALQLEFAKKNSDRELYWTRIAAENGHAVSQYNLAYEYWANGAGSEQDKIRAKFWLRKAADGGDPLAAATLEKLNAGEPW